MLSRQYSAGRKITEVVISAVPHPTLTPVALKAFPSTAFAINFFLRVDCILYFHILYVVYFMLYVVCFMFYDLFFMFYVLCFVFCVSCFVIHVSCSVFRVSCFVPLL